MARTGGDDAPFLISGDLHPNEAGARRIDDCSWLWLRDHLAALPVR